MGKITLTSYILVRQDSPVLIIGQAPARTDVPSNPISGKSGTRLAKLMDLTLDDFLPLFDRANLFNRYMGRHDRFKGDEFPLEEACLNAHKLINHNDLRRYKRIIVLGRNVAKAVGCPGREYLQWFDYGPEMPKIAVIPHPSGLNRWWNDPSNTEAAKQFLLELRDEVS